MKTVGYIKLYRALNEWEWKSEPNMVALFVHLLLNANYEKTRWRGLILEPGQLIVGRNTTPNICGISVNEYRKCLKRLEKTNEIIVKRTNKYSLVSLVNWAIYQSNEEKRTNKAPTKHQQSTNKAPQIKEVKKERSKESIYSLDFEKFWDSYVPIKTSDGKTVNKGSKQNTYAVYSSLISNYSVDELFEGAANYLYDCYRNDILSCSAVTFLNQKRFLNDFNNKTIEAKNDKKRFR